MKIKTALSSLTYTGWKPHEDSSKTALEVLGIMDDNFAVLSRWHTQRPDRGGKGWSDHKAGSCGGVEIGAHNQLCQIQADKVQTQPRSAACAHLYG